MGLLHVEVSLLHRVFDIFVQVLGLIVLFVYSVLDSLELKRKLCLLSLGVGYLLNRFKEQQEVFFEHLVFSVRKIFILFEFRGHVIKSL